MPTLADLGYGGPTEADAWDFNRKAVGDWVQRERAKSAAMGLWNDETGLPTPRGMGAAGSQIANALVASTSAPSANALKGITAYHGSPHDFDRFDISKIGTGEGAQVYGRGLYFAEHEPVAEGYKQNLTVRHNTEWRDNQSAIADAIAAKNKAFSSLLNRNLLDVGDAQIERTMAPHDEKLDKLYAQEKKLKEGGAAGRMYETRLNFDPDQTLHWDKPFSEQSPYVQERMKTLGAEQHMTGAQMYRKLQDDPWLAGAGGNPDIYATEKLKQAGIPGIRYLDQGSRNVGGKSLGVQEMPGGFVGRFLPSGQTSGAAVSSPGFKTQGEAQSWIDQHITGDQTHNYVVFDDKTIDILRKYGIAGLMGGAGAAAATAGGTNKAEAMPSYAEGTDYVPETGPAVVHEGEMIIPKDQADDLRRNQLTVTAKRPLSFDDMVGRWEAIGYPHAAAVGIARNMERESGGRPDVMGDGNTSGGLFQHHATRLTDLKAYAEEKGKPWSDPDIQIQFADKEMREKFPALRQSLLEGKDPAYAEDSFKRIFERPASVMWQNSAGGGPVLGTDRYQFSDYALGEHEKRKGSSLFYMDPQDYLDLSPDMEEEPFSTPAGRSLKASVGQGDQIQAVPSLDMKVNGQTGTITGQDGRHRALLAQEEGVDAIPVQFNQRGSGTPSEVVGMAGKALPFDFQSAAGVQRQPSDRGIVGRVMDMIVPPAEAAQPAAAQSVPDWAQDAPAATAVPDWAQENTAAAQPSSDDALRAKIAAYNKQADSSFGSGLLDLPVGAAQLVGNIAGGLGEFLPGKQGQEAHDFRERLNASVADREARIQAERGPDAGTDWARMGGNVVGSLPLAALGGAGSMAGGVLRAAGTGALRGAVGGAAGGALQPAVGPDFWQEKEHQAIAGGVAGGTLGALSSGLARTLSGPAIGTAERALMNEGIELTPGQMAGGAVKRSEDAMGSIPVLGSAIRDAQRRSIQTFNRAAINRGLASIGEQLPKGLVSGFNAVKYAKDKFTEAYRKVIPNMRGDWFDPQFRDDLTNLVFKAADKNLPPEYVQQLHFIIGNDVVSRFVKEGGHILGEDAQDIGTVLDGYRNALAQPERNPYEKEMGRLIGELDKAFDGMMERRNPVLAPIKRQIDRGYAQHKIIEDATTRAGQVRETPEGTFSPAQLDAAVTAAAKRVGRKPSVAVGEALMQDLSSKARNVLPQSVPDSGTPERAALMGVIAGGMHFEPHTAAILGGLAAPYTKLGMAAIQRMTRSPATKNFLANLGRGAGSAGALAGSSGEIPTITVRPQPPGPS
jgi:hypothetical protein